MYPVHSAATRVLDLLIVIYSLQELAVDVLFFLPTISEATARTCALICLSSAYSEAIATRIIDVVASRRQSDEDMSNVLSLLVSVLLAKVTKAKLDVTESRHDVLLRAVYVAMQRLGNPGRHVML